MRFIFPLFQQIEIMQRLLLSSLIVLFGTFGLYAQLITTDPGAPVPSAPLTITFDATEGNAGLAGCGCDVYLHAGLITSASTSGSDWQYTATTWGEANDAWKLTPVANEADHYTYTFSPTLREYFGVPEGEEILQLALVFRDATGDRQGKDVGNQDIFVQVNSGEALALNLTGAPSSETYALGRPLSVSAGTTAEATIELYDNDERLTSVTGTDLNYDVVLTTAGTHVIKVVATAGDEAVTDSFTVTGELQVERLSPATALNEATAGSEVTIAATSYVEAKLVLLLDEEALTTVTADRIEQTVTLPDASVTTYTVMAVYQNDTAYTTVTYLSGPPAVAAAPAGARPGATIMDDGSVLLLLRAPQKEDVFVVGNLNEWTPVASGRMTRTPEGESFWLMIAPGDLPEDGNLLYQYAIDDDGRFADPYSTLVLDPNDDPFIEETTFAGIPDYPTGQASGILTWLRLDAPEYAWEVSDFTAPDPEKMVVYELLIRDFVAAHDYATLVDTIDYLARLGVNAIELMPVSEFEGNISWGYNVSFHMALDKYYGAPEGLKAFVDAAHARGIAVILDVVYNHAFGESSLVRMWPGAQPYAPGEDNPYANVTARHPFNVGYDLNHESPLTREYVKTTVGYWLEEFHVDGFRFDLSKGFTQNFSQDVAAWNAYDASRVAILKDYADAVWSSNPEAYVIMEHLGESREENELAQYGNGMYFWSGSQPHDAYLEAAMGYNEGNKSNFSSALAENRGFDQRSLVAYMESHDEERMMYKNLRYGNAAGSYDVTQLPTALDRVELASTFFYSLPGPKMLWQFGELGYEYPINYCPDGTESNDCRTAPKPIVWEYREDADRQDVYKTISDLLYLRNNYDFFHGDITASDFGSAVKYVHLDSEDGQAAIVGNFDVTETTVTLPMPAAGTYYDYFSGESMTVTGTGSSLTLAPGEYRLYLSREVARGGGSLSTATNAANVARLGFTVSPNPTAGHLNSTFYLQTPARVTATLFDVTGRPVRELFRGDLTAGEQRLEHRLSGLPAGTYFLRLTEGDRAAVRPVIVR